MARGPVDLSRRCPACLFPPGECLCADVPRIETRTRFLLLRHASELNRPTNTGRWAALALPSARIVDYGLPGQELDPAPLAEPGTVVLFPSPHAPPLDRPPRQVVVLDATWAQARRMLQRIPALRALPRLPLPPRPRTATLEPMRRAPVAGGVSTLEAMAAALGLLGELDAARRLEALHLAALDRGWRLRRFGRRLPRCASA
jgi:DTW domain-containing protein YfiP